MMTLRFAVFVLAASTLACGGSSPTGPSDGGGGGGGGGGSTGGTTITITASGVSPRELTVPAGTRVTFINNDSRQHEMNSDPHPTHGDCPGIDDVGFISSGQTKLTGNLTTARRCGFHDHNMPEVVSLQGTIIVQ
jgi:plastocyanin